MNQFDFMNKILIGGTNLKNWLMGWDERTEKSKAKEGRPVYDPPVNRF